MDYEERANESAKRTALWGIDWPGHPESEINGAEEESLRDEPQRWTLLNVAADPEADYSYDDIAVMRRDDGLLVMVRTSGCSCPSPTETWGIVAKGTLADLIAEVDRDRKAWVSGGDRGPMIATRAFLEAMS